MGGGTSLLSTPSCIPAPCFPFSFSSSLSDFTYSSYYSSSSFCTFSPSPPFLLELGEPEKVENTPSAIYPIIQKCTTINSFCSQCGKCSPTEAGIPKNGFCTELAFIQGQRVRLFLHSIQQGLAITYVARLVLKLCSVIGYSTVSTVIT